MIVKTISFFFAALLFVTVSVLLPSCAKEGPQGIPGPQGDQGVAGPAGADGSVIYSGTGSPAASTGQDGDYYLDRNTGNLYGPKTATGWGTPISLGGGQNDSAGRGAQGPPGPPGPQGPQGPGGPTGAKGATGAAGSQIYSGSGAPASTLGTIGDFYLDKTNYELYGPKTANGWGTPTLLRGAQGPQGPAGPAGVAGSQIYSGAGAPAASLGTIGDYYLDKSNVNFYGPKTANGWGTPISLNGGTGGQGPAGPQGPPGATGATGAAGSQIYSGTTTPAASLGKTGDYYIDDLHAILYGPKTAAGWPATGLSLQVNNTITYNFVNKVQHNLPYNWVATIVGLALTGPTSNYINLPYNSTTAQTVGFTIPQAIVDNGIVLSYIRYFNGPANDTATDAGMSTWLQLPFSTLYRYIDPGSGEPVIVPVNINSDFDNNGFYIYLRPQVYSTGGVYASQNIPAEIRIVLIPASQVNTIQRISPALTIGK